MALKRTLTAAEHAALNPLLQAEYKPHGDGFVLDADDAVALLGARDREKNKAEAAQQALDAANTELTLLKKEAAKGNPDKEALVAANAEIARLKPMADALPVREAYIQKSLVGTEARNIAVKVFGEKNADAMLHHVTTRLQTDLSGAEPKAVVLDKDGKATAGDFVGLEKELRADPRFSGIVVVSKASGAAVPPGQRQPGSAGNPTTEHGTTPLLTEAKPSDLAASLREKYPDLQ